ncbi:hypothetical protein CAPTEDRAFT_177367 [Capitella teleta]|uniref:J domain-containing protein n=1 Tax=Capitella teleta TaxID=283909 RepID=R7U107_CAPTE|nr:hypothetical protein CAPTEDRAFT_177367 [Capitella teleta]|eukprot:ELT99888.1 hypothetical protein CAPTEDRAFT_177367 [Capitella teleta]
MATPEEDSDLVECDDYYAWLGLSKEATKDEINNAFRRMSRLYHPDKHANRPGLNEKAVNLFTKIKKAHEVLSDPQKRAIYDAVGIKGLELTGLEIVSRTKTPKEILEEYERIQKEQEEWRVRMSMNPRGSLTAGVDATDLFDRHTYSDEVLFAFPDIEMSELTISQSVECPLTQKDTVFISGNLTSHGGTGIGRFHVSMRRMLSAAGWAEVDIGAGNGISCDVRGFRNLWTHGYGTMSGSLQVTKKGRIVPGFAAMAASRFDKSLLGRITCNVAARKSALNTTVIWDPEPHRTQFSLTLGVPICEARLSYAYHFKAQEATLRAIVSVGNTGVAFEYGGNHQITKHSNLGMSVRVGFPSGVLLKIRLHRGSQTFLFPIHLSEEIVPQAVFYGTVVPVLLYFGVKVLVVRPFLKDKQEEELKKKKEANARVMDDKRRDAQAAMDLMQEVIARSYENEEEKGGLVIRKALFGKLQGDELHEHECIAVARQLQAMVKDSKIVIPAGTILSELPGFYDPCIGEEKQLFVHYDFRRQPHAAHFTDTETILIPNRNHAVNSPSEGD